MIHGTHMSIEKINEVKGMTDILDKIMALRPQMKIDNKVDEIKNIGWEENEAEFKG